MAVKLKVYIEGMTGDILYKTLKKANIKYLGENGKRSVEIFVRTFHDGRRLIDYIKDVTNSREDTFFDLHNQTELHFFLVPMNTDVKSTDGDLRMAGLLNR